MSQTSTFQIIDTGLRALLYTKFRDLLNFESIQNDTVTAPKRVARKRMAEIRGKSYLEFISIWRESISFDWSHHRTPVARRGVQLKYTDTSLKEVIVTAKAVPATIPYSVRFWSRDRNKLELCIERWLFWIHNSPFLIGEFEEEYEWKFRLQLESGTINDESEVETAENVGEQYIFQFPLMVNGWVFAKDSVRTVKTIHLAVYYKDDLETDADYEEIVIEDSGQDVEKEAVLRILSETI